MERLSVYIVVLKIGLYFEIPLACLLRSFHPAAFHLSLWNISVVELSKHIKIALYFSFIMWSVTIVWDGYIILSENNHRPLNCIAADFLISPNIAVQKSI